MNRKFAQTLGLLALASLLAGCANCLPGAERRDIMSSAAQSGEISYPSSSPAANSSN